MCGQDLINVKTKSFSYWLILTMCPSLLRARGNIVIVLLTWKEDKLQCKMFVFSQEQVYPLTSDRLNAFFTEFPHDTNFSSQQVVVLITLISTSASTSLLPATTFYFHFSKPSLHFQIKEALCQFGNSYINSFKNLFHFKYDSITLQIMYKLSLPLNVNISSSDHQTLVWLKILLSYLIVIHKMSHLNVLK